MTGPRSPSPLQVRLLRVWGSCETAGARAGRRRRLPRQQDGAGSESLLYGQAGGCQRKRVTVTAWGPDLLRLAGATVFTNPFYELEEEERKAEAAAKKAADKEAAAASDPTVNKVGWGGSELRRGPWHGSLLGRAWRRGSRGGPRAPLARAQRASAARRLVGGQGCEPGAVVLRRWAPGSASRPRG
jgi:hypothetical protein